MCIKFTFKIRHVEYADISKYIEKVIETYTSNSFFKDYDFRPVSYPSNPTGKLPIATIGCSFTYGLYLNQEDTFASQLANFTGRTVYNLGVVAASPREILYILRNDELRNELLYNEQNLEYIIYPFISNHLQRLYMNIRLNPLTPYFKLKDGSLEFYDKNHFIQKSYIFRLLYELKYKEKDDLEAYNLFTIYMKEANKEIKKHYPSAKFVILVYEDYLDHDWKELENEGIIVIKVKDMTVIDVYSSQYSQSAIDSHPNKLAWEKIIPILAEKLNLIQ
ncbi:hypothetical protein IJ182_03240 [bacterium]|nr:hypothetical protein [bacterium]